mmetsp:Transcript_26947/g.37881  ORF Transcript_26947/g.37881 Transcript_26947/m.37881 type:complete len:95 (+) Transcript_26947:1091-1375(+)
MSKYHQQLIQHIQDNPRFIRPEQHRNQILTRLQADELRDLSISRNSFSWGVPVPESFEGDGRKDDDSSSSSGKKKCVRYVCNRNFETLKSPDCA